MIGQREKHCGLPEYLRWIPWGRVFGEVWMCYPTPSLLQHFVATLIMNSDFTLLI